MFPLKFQRLTGRSWAALPVLVLLGFLGNFYALPLFFGADFVFGSIAVFLILYGYGLSWGLLAALVINSYTWVLWGHPYGFFTFVLEALFVGYLLHSGRKNLLLLDGIFWLLIGFPLNGIFYYVVLHMDAVTTSFIVLKQGTNGIFNALLAGLAINHLPLDRLWGRPPARQTFSLQEGLFNLIAALVLVLALLLTVVEIRTEMKNFEQKMLTDLQNLSTNIQAHLHSWYQQHLQAVSELAEFAANSSLKPSPVLQNGIKLIQRAFPAFHNMYVANAAGITVGFYPPTNERGESTIGLNFSDRPYFKELQKTKEPVLSEVFIGRGGVFKPIVALAVPIIQADRFAGFALGALNLGGVQDLLEPYGKASGAIVTLTDARWRVIASTSPERAPWQSWDRKKTGLVHPMSSNMFIWSPPDENLPSMTRWQRSSFVAQNGVGDNVPWILTVEMPIAPQQRHLYAIYVQNLAIMTVLTILTLLLTLALSRWLAKPLNTLAQVTTDLPDKIQAHQKVDWPTSTATEVDSLLRNFQSMTRSLEQNFQVLEERGKELANSNAVLKFEIAERKRAEEASAKHHLELQETAQGLDQSMNMLQLIIESIPVRVFWKDDNLRYLGCNTLFARDAGLNHPQQLLGKDDFAMGWRDQADLYRADDRQVMDSRRPKLNIIEPQTTPSGATIWLDTSKVPLQNPNGEVIGLLGIYEDITVRIESEEALRDSEEKYRGLIETTNTGYVIVDLEGKVLDANTEYVRLTGHHELSEILGRSVIEWIAKQDHEKYAAEVKNCIQQGSVKNFEVIYDGKDGQSIPVEVNGTIIRGSSAAKIINLVRDITDRKQAEAALRQSEEQLQQAQKMEAVGKLAGGIAHDFNNILTAISGQSELLLLDLADNDPRRHDVQEIQRAAERAASLTRQLLAFSRKQIIQPRVLYLNELILNLDKMLRRLIPEEVEIISIPGVDLGRVFADPGQIEQSVVNLVVNACDAMPQGGKLTIETANVDPDVEYCQRHAQVRPGPYVMLAVSDTGIGMDSETQSHIFEPFFTTKGIGQGTGLGLSMVYGIVNQNGGYIGIYSEPGQGTAFKIYLPRIVEAGESGEPLQISCTSYEGSETILLLEDEDMVREITRRMLQKEGYLVLTASSGSEALLIGEQHKGAIQLILSDVVMPDMSGPETVGGLRPMHSEAKVLYMSGHTENAIVHHKVLDPGVAFIQKPFRRDTLLRKVRELLDTFSDK